VLFLKNNLLFTLTDLLSFGIAKVGRFYEMPRNETYF